MLHERISNKYLKEEKLIKAKNRMELDIKIQDQLKRWQEKELKAKQQHSLKKLKETAIIDTNRAIQVIEDYKNILLDSLKQKHILDWESFYDNRNFQCKEPNQESFKSKLNIPKEQKFLEAIFPSIRRERIEKQNEAENLFKQEMSNYHQEKKKFKNKQIIKNGKINKQKNGYEEIKPRFVEKYFEKVINHSNYPAGFKKTFNIQYINESKSLIINFDLPSTENVPKIIEHKFVQAKKEIKIQTMNKKDFENYYDNIIYQIALRNIYECFSSDYVNSIDLVVFNGWINGVEASTGLDFHSCIISLQATKDEFLSLNLNKVVPKECFRKLKGLNASALHMMAPIKPIMEINREDKRFIESKEMLADINTIPNLAEMDWNDFEHLIRQLFETYFSKQDLEVQVTQASRDGGIDAIAFNPDPFIGGKIIIQAKRYNNPVPINDVRALHGVMAKEGAMKGIMVTTSSYGKESLEYVKDLPISLINGNHLLHMFQELGFDVQIQLKEKQINNKKLI